MYRYLIAPFRFAWNYSDLLAPARMLMSGAKGAGDHALAAGYLVAMSTVVYWAAVTLSWTTMFGLGAVAMSVILLRFLSRRRF